MKKLVISLFLTVSIILSGASFNTVYAQSDTTSGKTSEEQTQKDSPKKAVEAKVVQDTNPNGLLKNWFVGVKGGATFFLAPLKDNPFSWGAAATLGKQLNSKVAIRADYLYGNLKSDGHFIRENADGSYYENDLKLNVDFMEIGLILKLNMNDFIYSKSPKYLREFYLFGGGAYTMFRSKVTDNNDSFLSGNGYTKTGEQDAVANLIAVPLGIGVTYKLDKNDFVNLNAEFGYRFVQTEGLNGGLTESASQYTFSSLGLLFNLGRPGTSPQKITSDVIKEELGSELRTQVSKDINAKLKAEIKPLREELAKQSVEVANNHDQLEILQEEMEARTNAIKEQLNMGSEDLSNNSGDGTSGSGIVYRGAGGSGGSGIDVSSIYFAFNSTYITAAMQREIATIARVLKKNKNLRCEVIGNSSNVGSPEYNTQLSQKRAESVMNLLIEEFNISEDRLTLTNSGLDDPLAKNIKKINRRVDLIIK